MDVKRLILKQKISASLEQRSILWLSGVRRVGKTTLCKSLGEAIYFDCELPRVRAQLEDPEGFWHRHQGKLVVLDEIHRLPDPSNVLKIAADHFPTIKVVATGSSTLSARRKFKDTLTDRKRSIWVQPLMASELLASGHFDLDRRLMRGGLPQAYLSDAMDDSFYTEWLDSFWAKDVQELFVIEKKTSFLKLAELILRFSGEMFDAQSFAVPTEISRQTVINYLDILETTLFALRVRPFTRGRANDIVAMPKVYAFDTGFVCYARGWDQLRSDDRGTLIEHLVLSELLSDFGKENVFYWRNKQKQEVDFVVKATRGPSVQAVECKSNYLNFNPAALQAFRRQYSHGKNFLYAANVLEPMTLTFDNLIVEVLPMGQSIRSETS